MDRKQRSVSVFDGRPDRSRLEPNGYRSDCRRYRRDRRSGGRLRTVRAMGDRGSVRRRQARLGRRRRAIGRDAKPYEKIKMRLLNAAQSTFSHLGAIVGHGYSFEAAGDPVLIGLTRRMLESESASTLPVVEGMGVGAYIESRLGADRQQRHSASLSPDRRRRIAEDRPAARRSPEGAARVRAKRAAADARGCWVDRLLSVWRTQVRTSLGPVRPLGGDGHRDGRKMPGGLRGPGEVGSRNWRDFRFRSDDAAHGGRYRRAFARPALGGSSRLSDQTGEP